MNRYIQHVRSLITVTKRDAALGYYSVWHRLDLCGHELLFVSAATLIFDFFKICISCAYLCCIPLFSHVLRRILLCIFSHRAYRFEMMPARARNSCTL